MAVDIQYGILVAVLLTSSQAFAYRTYQKKTDQYDVETKNFLPLKYDQHRETEKTTRHVKIEPIGCFADAIPRALSKLYFNARENEVLNWSTWPNMNNVIDNCASHAAAEGFKVFGIQHYGECWGEPGQLATIGYDIYGASDKCVQGVGRDWTNYVYRILPQKKCNIDGQEYNEGDTVHLPNIPDILEDTTCQTCTCQGGKAANCRELYHCHISYNKCEKYIKTKESCCPVCGCYHKGRKVPEGYRWTKWLNDEECQECVCENGKGRCTTRKHRCLPCANPVIVEGQCCPKCGLIPTTLPWFTIPFTTQPPVLTFPVLSPEIKRVLIDRLIKRMKIRRRRARTLL